MSRAGPLALPALDGPAALPERVFIPRGVAVGADGVLDVERAIRFYLDAVLERGYGWRLDEDLARDGWMLTLTPPGRRLRAGSSR